jgi:hypothetical protein
MSRFVVDTNVPVVANGRSNDDNDRPPSTDCRAAAILFLQRLLRSGTILIDLAGEIQAEYRTYLDARGQPGVGDRFYQAVINSAPKKIVRIDLPKRDDGEFTDLPQELIDVGFDPSDRKFAALAKRGRAMVVNAIDSDWLIHLNVMKNNGISVKFICGCDRPQWFAG